MSRFSQFLKSHKLLIMLVFVLALTAVSFAQGDPEPVTIDLPLDDIFTYLNQWLTVFAPIVLFVGMIPVAMALLRYIANLLKSAFGAGK